MANPVVECLGHLSCRVGYELSMRSEAAKRMALDLALTREQIVEISSEVACCERCWLMEQRWRNLQKNGVIETTSLAL